MRALLYVTDHGFGHTVRTGVVGQALADAGAEVWVRGPDRPYPGATGRLDGPTDGGVHQADSVTMDLAATLRHGDRVLAEHDARVERELAHLDRVEPDVIVSDVPALPFAAAARAGVPAVGLANFGWDWIYDHYVAREPRFAPIVEHYRACYASAGRLLRLPLHPTGDDAFPTWPAIDDVPVIGRAARRPRDEVRAALGVPDGQPMALLSFGGFGLRELDARALVDDCPGVCFVCPGLGAAAPDARAGVIPLPRDGWYHPDLVAAADVVLSKPGFGIVAECVVNRTRLIYCDRGDFREYPVLARAIDEQLAGRHLPRADLAAGRVGQAVRAMLDQPEPTPTLAAGGEHEVVRRLQELVE